MTGSEEAPTFVGRDAAAFIDEFPDALIVITVDGRVVSWSRGAESVFGFTRSEVLGRHLQEVVSPTDGAAEREAWRAAIATGTTQVYETSRRRKDGSTIIIDASARAVTG